MARNDQWEARKMNKAAMAICFLGAAWSIARADDRPGAAGSALLEASQMDVKSDKKDEWKREPKAASSVTQHRLSAGGRREHTDDGAARVSRGELVPVGPPESLQDWEAFWLFKTFRGYDILFAVSAVMRLLAVVVFLPFIHDATARPTMQAVRFMMSNVYNNLFNALQQPVKMLRLGREETERRKAA